MGGTEVNAATVPMGLLKESERISFDAQSDDEVIERDVTGKQGAPDWVRALLLRALSENIGSGVPVFLAHSVAAVQPGACYFANLGEASSSEASVAALVEELGDRRRRSSEHERVLSELASRGLEAIGPISAFVGKYGTDEVIQDAAAVLAEIGSASAALARLVSELLCANETSVQVAAARAVAGMGVMPASDRVAQLARCFRSGSCELREAAAACLAEIRGNDALVVLRDALEVEANATVREALEQAIDECDD